MNTKIKVLLISYFYDGLNTNSICIKEVVDCFIKEGISVSVLCCHKGEDIPEDNIYLAPSFFLRVYERIRTSRSHLNLLSKMKYAFLGICRRINIEKYFESLFLKKRVILYGCDLINQLKITHIISISNPFINHNLAFQIKKRTNDVKWVMYQLDPYTFNYGLTNRQQEERLREELTLSLYADKIVLTDGTYDDNYKNAFMRIDIKKIRSFPLPNLTLRRENNAGENDRKKNNRITLLFSGNIYESIRDPSVLLNMLMSVNDPRFVLEVYGWGMETILERYETLKPCVNIHGRVSKEEVEKAIASASILINLGNIMTNQTPSKIFDYISSGKPIINFSYSDKDTSLKYLGRYPLFLNILNEEAGESEAIERFRSFCYKNNSMVIPKDAIFSLYIDILSNTVCNEMKEFMLN